MGILTGVVTLIGDYFKEDNLHKLMGMRIFFIGLTAAFFSIIGGILADIGWRFPFLLYMIQFFFIPYILFFISDHPEHKPNIREKKKLPNNPLPLKNLLPMYCFIFIAGSFGAIIIIFLPFYLTSIKISATKLGVSLACYGVSWSIAALYYKKIKTYLTYKKIFILCFMLVGAGFIIIASANSYYPVVAGLVIIGLGFGLCVHLQ